MGGAGASGNGGEGRAGNAVVDRDVAGNHVDDVARDVEGRDASGSTFQEFAIAFQGAGQAADAGADDDAGALAQGRVVTEIEAAICDGVYRCGIAVVDEAVHFAGFFGVQVAGEVKSLHGTAKTHGQCRRVIIGDRGDAAFACEDVVPCAGDAAADGANDAHAGHDDTRYGSVGNLLRHVFLPLRDIKKPQQWVLPWLAFRPA